MKIMYTPVNPSFTIYKWGVTGCTLHGHVSMMKLKADATSVNPKILL